MGIVAVFAADLHLSDCIWSTHPSIAGDSFYALQQLVDLAIKHNCPLLLAGDVLELMRTGSPTSVTVSEVSNAISRLRSAGQPLYYICGQHDLAEPSWLQAINPWARDVSMQSFQLAGKPWYAIGYQETLALEYAVTNIPEDTFGLMVHQRWREFEGGSTSHGTLVSIVKERPGIKVVISGDLHQTKLKKFRQSLFISPGATHKRTVAEPDTHNAILVDDTGTVFTNRLKSRSVVSVVVRDDEHWERLCVRLPQHIAEATNASLKALLPRQLATPLLVIEDQGRCGAAADAKERFTDAHVLVRNSTLEKVAVTKPCLLYTSPSPRD